jgi:EpsD family peptidyl-prolyl cis-trans isomerase
MVCCENTAIAWRRRAGAAVLVGAVTLLAACGAKDQATTQTAARVNKEEITVHQIGALLSQQQAVGAEQVPQLERQILERLIDRELAVQKAAELKLDREPRIVQAIEAARQDIIARAYADKLGEGAGRPTPAEVKRYYDEHPALFRERKVYQLQEIAVQADAKQVAALQSALAPMKSANEIAAYLKGNDLKFASTQSVRAAEQLPLTALSALSRLGEGQWLLNPTANGAQIVVVNAARSQPVDEERAARAIEQFLINEQKRKLLADDLKALRAAAKIEYRGRFAASAPLAAETPQTTAADVAASAAATIESKSVNDSKAARAAPVEAVDAAAAPASGIDASTVNKGLGLK